jgi:hypothetical protein
VEVMIRFPCITQSFLSSLWQKPPEKTSANVSLRFRRLSREEE